MKILALREEMFTLGSNGLRRDHQKNFRWPPQLWVSRRKEPILCYVPKNDKKKNSGSKGLNVLFVLRLTEYAMYTCMYVYIAHAYTMYTCKQIAKDGRHRNTTLHWRNALPELLQCIAMYHWIALQCTIDIAVASTGTIKANAITES